MKTYSKLTFWATCPSLFERSSNGRSKVYFASVLKRTDAQTGLEALIVLCFFLGIVCFGFVLMKENVELGKEKINILNAKNNALACSVVLNSFYSNNSEEVNKFNVNCSVEKNSVSGFFNGKKKKGFFIGEGNLISDPGKKLVLQKLKHYE